MKRDLEFTEKDVTKALKEVNANGLEDEDEVNKEMIAAEKKMRSASLLNKARLRDASVGTASAYSGTRRMAADVLAREREREAKAALDASAVAASEASETAPLKEVGLSAAQRRQGDTDQEGSSSESEASLLALSRSPSGVWHGED